MAAFASLRAGEVFLDLSSEEEGASTDIALSPASSEITPTVLEVSSEEEGDANIPLAVRLLDHYQEAARMQAEEKWGYLDRMREWLA